MRMTSPAPVVVVTGAFGALGRAVAEAFARRGARLALVDLAPPPPAPGAEGGAAPLVFGGVDLTDAEATRRVMAATAMRFGGIDVLVNIAGGFRWERLEDGDPDTCDQLYALNLRTAVVCCKAALPALLERGTGRIVNVGAGAAAARAGAGMGPYTASKAGVQRLTESLAEEVKDRGITVNAILPGVIDTPRNRADMPDADFSRWVAPEAIAEVIVFLASEAARAVTGASIPVLGRG
jgi:NAD(P)-dependent dehydrogenase (short-subunit alcohol dehydrogenase family)